MQNASKFKGILLAAAIVLAGAGCSGSGSVDGPIDVNVGGSAGGSGSGSAGGSGGYNQ